MRVRTVCFIVVGPALELGRSAHVAHAVDLRLLEVVVIGGAAAGAGEAADDALDQSVFVDLELDHMVEGAAALGEQQVERFGLVPGAREAVEDRAAVRRARRDARRSAR